MSRGFWYLVLFAGGGRCVMSTVNAHETATVLRLRHGAMAVERFWQLLTDSEIDIVPFDEMQVRAAAVAFDLFGKGINPKAQQSVRLRGLCIGQDNERAAAVQG